MVRVWVMLGVEIGVYWQLRGTVRRKCSVTSGTLIIFAALQVKKDKV